MAAESMIGYPSSAYYSNFFFLRFPILVDGVLTTIQGHDRFAVLHIDHWNESVPLPVVMKTIESVLMHIEGCNLKAVQSYYDKTSPIISICFPSQKILENVKSMLLNKDTISQLICTALQSLFNKTSIGVITVQIEMFLCSPDNEFKVEQVTLGNARFHVDTYEKSLLFDFPSIMDQQSNSGKLGRKVKFSDHVRELIATADIWYELGIQLEVPPHILRIIRAENTSLIRCLTDMLVWLDENVQISWTKTVQALIIVDRKELARGICLKYCIPFPEENGHDPGLAESYGDLEIAKVRQRRLKKNIEKDSKLVHNDLDRIIQDDYPTVKKKLQALIHERDNLRKKLDLERENNQLLVEIRYQHIEEEKKLEQDFLKTKTQLQCIMKDLSQKSTVLEIKSKQLNEVEEALQKADNAYENSSRLTCEKERRDTAKSNSQMAYVAEIKIALEEKLLIQHRNEIKKIHEMLSNQEEKIVDVTEAVKNCKRSLSLYGELQSVDVNDFDLNAIELQLQLTMHNIELVDIRSEYALKKIRKASLEHEIEHSLHCLKQKRNLLPCLAKTELQGISFPVHKTRINSEVDFNVVLLDEDGEFCTGHHVLSATISTVCDQPLCTIFATYSKSQYAFKYMPKLPAEYTVEIYVNNIILNHMPPIKFFAMNSPHLPNCYAKGQGTKQAVKNKVASFQLFLADEDKLPVNSLQTVTVSLNCRERSDCLVLPIQTEICHLPSIYNIRYIPDVAGECILTVFVNGNPVGEPFTVAVDKCNFTPLVGTAYQGELEFVRHFTKQAEKSEMNVALCEASRNGHMDTISHLIECGANTNFRNKSKRTPLIIASCNGHYQAVDLLVRKGADVTAKDKNSRSALMRASWEGHTTTVKTLLKFNADVNDEDMYGDSPLHDAARNGHNSVIEILLQSGADVETKNNNEQTPLMLAASKGHCPAASTLINNGANPNSKDAWLRTPLLFAVEHCHYEMVELLCECGGEVNADNYKGNKCLHIASCAGKNKANKKQKQILSLLIARGAKVNALNNDLESPLLKASSSGYLEAVHLLIRNGADTNARDAVSRTAIDCARNNNHKDVYEYLQSIHHTIV